MSEKDEVTMAEPQKRYGPYEIVKAIGKGTCMSCHVMPYVIVMVIVTAADQHSMCSLARVLMPHPIPCPLYPPLSQLPYTHTHTRTHTHTHTHTHLP
jgi:hypothetical protein